MLRVAEGVSSIRRWTEVRQGWPCRCLDGRLAVGFAGEVCRGIEIGWGEFEVTYCLQRAAFVLDDAPDSRTCFVGPPEEARRFLADLTGWAAAAPTVRPESTMLLPAGGVEGRIPRPPAGEAR